MASHSVILVPSAEVSYLSQRTLCLAGNASELTSQMICQPIMERSWLWWLPSAQDTLLEEDFQFSLTKRVKQDTTLSKRFSITKHHQKGKDALPLPAISDQRQTIFSRGLSYQVWGQTGQKSFPYSQSLTNESPFPQLLQLETRPCSPISTLMLSQLHGTDTSLEAVEHWSPIRLLSKHARIPGPAPPLWNG